MSKKERKQSQPGSSKSDGKNYSVEETRTTYPSAYKKWTKIEDQRLLDLITSGISSDDIAVELGRAEGAISSRAKKLQTTGTTTKNLRRGLQRSAKQRNSITPTEEDPRLVYVLALEDEKYYIGKTTELNSRLRMHCRGFGSSWTKKYRPLRLLDLYRDAPDVELNVTLWYINTYGIENVRGAGWTSDNPNLNDPQTEMTCSMEQLKDLREPASKIVAIQSHFDFGAA